MRRYLAAGIWLALTVTATAIVWTAVSVVAADVTDRPAPVVAHRDVVVALGGSAAPGGVATTAVPRPSPPVTTRPSAPVTVTTAPVGRSGPTVTAAAVATTTSTAPTSTKPPVRTSVVPTTVPPTTSPPSTAPPAGTATYSTDGGAVGVACTGFNSIRLVVALPNDGYQAIVTSGGPYFVQVNFVGHGRNLPVGAACVFAVPFEFNQFNQGAPGPSGG